MYTTLSGLIWIDGRKLIKDGDEFIQECLALHTEQEMFEIIVCKIRHPAAVGPQLHCGNVKIFFPHNILDCRLRQMERIDLGAV